MVSIGYNSEDYIEKKIMGLPDVVKKVEELKKHGKTIVTNNGSYDIMHIGHVVSLFEAKKQGDILVVGVNSDKSVKSYKGPKRPIIGEEMRVRMVAALPCVDFVTTFDEPECIPFVAAVKPDVHTNGSEYGEECIEAATVKANGGRIHLLPMVDGIKTSEIIKRIQDVYTSQEIR